MSVKVPPISTATWYCDNLLKWGVVRRAQQCVEDPRSKRTIDFRLRADLVPLRVGTECRPCTLAVAFVLEGYDVDKPVGIVTDRGRPVSDVLDSVSFEDSESVVSESER